jgi:hypothetical protein
MEKIQEMKEVQEMEEIEETDEIEEIQETGIAVKIQYMQSIIGGVKGLEGKE